MTDPVLIAGATGTQGDAVARALLARGRRVRALTRSPGKEAAKQLGVLGAEVVAGDFDDPASVRLAAAGTAAVFAMGTPFEGGSAAEERQCIALIDAAREAGTRHIVYSSVASAIDKTGIPHFESKAAVERHLAALGVPYTVLAPVAFLENVFAPWVAPGIAEGRYAFGMAGDIPLQQVAIADLAAFAALVLEQSERFTGRRIELASVQQTGHEFARVLSRWVGHEVTFVEQPVDPANDLRLMMGFLRRGGYHVDIPALRATYPEIAWHDVEAWAAEQDWTQLRGSA